MDRTDMNDEYSIMASPSCDLVIMPHGTGLYFDDKELLLRPRDITITDVKCGDSTETVTIDTLITYYEQQHL